MSEPVLTLILIAAFTLVLAVMRYFKTLESDFWEAARNPIVAGIVAGLVLRLLEPFGGTRIVVTAVLLTLAALYARLTGDESEPSDGMLLGALSGALTAVPLALHGDDALRAFAESVLAGAAAGFGVTFAVAHVADKFRQLAWDVVAVIGAIGAAWLPTLAARFGIDDRRIAFAAAGLIPAITIATVLKQWPDIRAELRHEASLGFIDDNDVRPTAHPLLRFGRNGWADASAHREFVRIANRLALRKRQQRHRAEDMARLYQLEIIKLRMQLQEMTRIDARSRSPEADHLTSA